MTGQSLPDIALDRAFTNLARSITPISMWGNHHGAAPEARIHLKLTILGATFNVDLFQVGYQLGNEPLWTRTSRESPVPSSDHMQSGMNDELDQEIRDRYVAFGLDGTMETIFFNEREYALFIYPCC